MNNKIKKAIEKLKLNDDELNVITIKNIEKISKLANCSKLNVMYYLRYER